ncbi:hypothetical protein AMECASPLE_022416, partial [Ameca splendens]
WVTGKLVPISRSLLAGGRVHPGQVASPLQGNTQTIKHTLIHPPKGNFQRDQLTEQACLWTVGGTRSTWKEPRHAWGEHANSMQKDPRPGVKPRTFLLQGNSATNCATVQPYL